MNERKEEDRLEGRKMNRRRMDIGKGREEGNGGEGEEIEGKNRRRV